MEDQMSLGAANLTSAETIKIFQERERQRKYLYLLQEIEDENYSIKHFIEFVDSGKILTFCPNMFVESPTVLQIDDYTLEELKQNVRDFKILNLPLKEANPYNKWELFDKNFGIDRKLVESLITSTSTKENNDNTSDHNIDDDEDYQDINQQYRPAEDNPYFEKDPVKLMLDECSKLPEFAKTNIIDKGPLNINTVKCRAIEVLIIKANPLLQLNQKLQIRIKTELVEAEDTHDVKRTFEEFQLLRQWLVKKYPYYVVPALPLVLKPRKLDSIKLRIQKFINRLMRSEVFKADKEVTAFFTHFENMTKHLKDKLKEKLTELGLFNIYTVDGKARIRSEETHALYATKFQDFQTTYNGVYYHMFKAMKDARNLARVLGYLFKIVGDVLIRIDKIHKEVLEIPEEYHYGGVGRGMKDQSAFMFELGECLYTYLKRKLEYNTDLGRVSFYELWDNRLQFKDRLTKLQQNLEQRKLRLFENGNIDYWGIKDQDLLNDNREQLLKDFEFAQIHMLHQETEDLERIRHVYQFLTNQLADEVGSELDVQSKEMNGEMLEMGKRIEIVETPLLKEWATIMNQPNQ